MLNMTIVETVVKTLKDAGVRVSRAYPPGVSVERNEVVAAVQYYSLDQAKGQAQVLISVFAPPKLGAQVCEDTALQICKVLYAAGGLCQTRQMEYLEKAGVFCTNVYASYLGQETENGWKPYEQPEEE